MNLPHAAEPQEVAALEAARPGYGKGQCIWPSRLGAMTGTEKISAANRMADICCAISGARNAQRQASDEC